MNIPSIVRTNPSPQDIEYTAERSHLAIRGGCTAAFGISVHGQERAVVVAELRDAFRGDPDSVAYALRTAIAEEHQIILYDVVLVPARTIPRTTDGKIRRSETRDRYLTGWLVPWYAPAPRTR